MDRPIPCILERRLVPKVWGGRRLERVLGIELPPDQAIGETWEAYDRPDGASAVRGAPGVTLADLVRRDAVGWLGARFAAAERFPLLLKFIDAREALSVQLHPDDALAVGDSGKTEAWIVLDAGESARIVRGLRGGAGRAELEAALGGDAIEDVLHSFRPEPGQAVLVEAGTVHAIGPDVVVFEVQQNSDLTYRLWDWGRPRELHVEAALEALRVPDQPEPDTVAPEPCEGGNWLVRHRVFSVRRFEVREPRGLDVEGEFKLLTVLSGQGTIGWRSGGDDPPIFARSGETVLVPAAVEQIFVSPIGVLDVLWTAPGPGATS